MTTSKPRNSRFGNLEQLPSGRYRARYRPPYTNEDGTICKPLQYNHSEWLNALGPGKTFPDKTKGREALDAIYAEIITGTWKHPNQIVAEAEAAKIEAERQAAQEALDAYTAGEWVTEWLENIDAGNYSANTSRTYHSDIKPFLEKFADTPLKQITGEDLTAWERELTRYTRTYKDGIKKKKTRSPQTIQAKRTVAKACLNAAVEAGRINTNPMPKAVKRTRVSKGVQNRLDYIPEETLVLAARDYAAPPIAAAITLAYYCGLRNGEVRALRRKHLVLTGDHPKVLVRHGMQRGRNGEQVKGDGKSVAAIRDIPLDATTTEWLRRYLLEHVDKSPEALVVFNPTTGGQLADDALRDGKKRWRDAAQHAGIEEGFRFHDLRAACLTRLGQAGATTAQLMKFAGHSDVSTVQIYQRADQQGLEALVNRREPTVEDNIVDIDKHRKAAQ